MVGIYKITNPKGRIYIGQSIKIETRWKSYKKMHCTQQPKIYNSLKKYGPQNHTFEVIEECEPSELDNREVFYKIKYDSVTEGLNCELYDTGGGEKSEKTRKKMSLTHKGTKKPWAGKNSIISPPQRKRMIEGMENIKNPLYQYNLEGEFIKKWNKPKYASKELNINNGYLHTITDNLYKTLGGYRWTSTFYSQLPPITKNFKSKKITIQYDLDGNFIKEWDSVKQASQELNIRKQNISACCRGINKTSGGFIWKFKTIKDAVR